VDIGVTPCISRTLLFILTAVGAAFALLFSLRGSLRAGGSHIQDRPLCLWRGISPQTRVA
jgi:hypothetical protein